MQFPTNFSDDKVHMMLVDYNDGTIGVLRSVNLGLRNMNEQITLNEQEARYIIDSLETWLRERDPAYIAHMEKAAALGEIQPATDAEYAAYLAGEVKS